jgi:DNA-3-methyladenine glycosylase I
MKRCWQTDNPLLITYHDQEWGVPVHDDRKHFEFLVLESMQAGLSWITILKKRENFRSAFHNFNPGKITLFNDKNISGLLNNPGIIRNRKKIEAIVHNAGRFLEIQEEFSSFDAYIWKFVHNKQITNTWRTLEQLPATTELSVSISRDLKKRGFKFLGPITVYAHMQAAGLVNDHLISCFRYQQIKEVSG